MSTDPVPLVPETESASSEKSVSKLFQVIGWFSAGVVVAAFSIYLGAELRSRSLTSSHRAALRSDVSTSSSSLARSRTPLMRGPEATVS